MGHTKVKKKEKIYDFSKKRKTFNHTSNLCSYLYLGANHY